MTPNLIYEYLKSSATWDVNYSGFSVSYTAKEFRIHFEVGLLKTVNSFILFESERRLVQLCK